MFLLHTPSLYSQSILLSTIPLYNPFLQLVVPLVTNQPLHMTKSHLMLHLHSPSLSPLYSSPFYIPFSTSPFYTPSISSFYNLPLHPFLQFFSAPLFYIPSLHPSFTPYLPPIYIYPPHASPPFDTPFLHSLSIFLIYSIAQSPLGSPLVTRQPPI